MAAGVFAWMLDGYRVESGRMLYPFVLNKRCERHRRRTL